MHPVMAEEKKVNDFLLDLNKHGHIEDGLYNKLRSMGGTIFACFYAIHETHFWKSGELIFLEII